jgi:hypothetical protein
VAMHDSPPSAAGTPADVRHPEGGLRACRTVDEGGVPFYVDRVGQVTARARREVADVNLPSPNRLAAQSKRLLTASQPCSYAPRPPKIVTSAAWDHNCL